MSFLVLCTDMAQEQGHFVMCSSAKEHGASWSMGQPCSKVDSMSALEGFVRDWSI